MRNNTMNHILSAMLTMAALLVGQCAWAASSFTVECNNNTFTITRTSNTTTTETVWYRTVSLSALAGKHFTPRSGELVFNADQNTRSITVTETASGNVDTKYRFQNSTSRTYRFEVTDQAGFYLAHCDRTIDYSDNYKINGDYTYSFINNLVYFSSGKVYSSMASGKFYDVAHAGTVDTDLTIDDGYDYDNHTLCTVSTTPFFNQVKAPQSYLDSLGYKLYATVYFQQKEKNDGYQYIQILTDNSSTYDGKDGDGAITNGPSKSVYKAAFILTKTESVLSDIYKYQAFPHKTDDTYNSQEFDYWDSYLYQQKFLTSSYRADNSGSLVLSPKVNSISVRFDANGSGDDTWYVRNLKVRFALCDATAPTILSRTVSSGKHARGNRFYFSVAFSEIVTISGNTKKLSSSWGDLTYVTGTNTNVLTFMGTVPDEASGPLNITGLTGEIKDLSENIFSSDAIKANGICALDDSYVFHISYDLAGGQLTSNNPTTYKWETASFTLNNPFRPGYVFAGWTGSNGNSPQTTVTISKHSSGDRSYTANWTPVWTGSGTQADPYIITTTQGLDALASFVSYGNDCNGLYFELGSDIEYAHTSTWIEASSQEYNYYAIGTIATHFKGSFDGKNHTISGIRLYKGSEGSNSSYQGVFGVVDHGTIRNISLSDSRIHGRHYAGGIAGYIINQSVVEGCTVGSKVAVHTLVNDSNHHGGIVGFNKESTVQACISRATLSVSNYISTSDDYGAIVGRNQSGNVLDCIAISATVPAFNTNTHGAIAGTNDAGSLLRNYYSSCTIAGVNKATDKGCNGADVISNNGAVSLHTVSLPENVSIDSRSVIATLPGNGYVTYSDGARIKGTEYYAAGNTYSLNYTAELSSGYGASYSATGGTITNNTLTMAASDATIKVGVYKNEYITHWQAAPDVHEGTTKLKSFLITTPEGLVLLSSEVEAGNNFDGKCFMLGNDIDMSGVANFTPIGLSSSKQFRGLFYGEDHTISHLTIDRSNSNNAGLFGYLSVNTASHIILDNARITGTNYVGGIVGTSASATLEDCKVTRSIITATYKSSDPPFVGAIVGYEAASNCRTNDNTYHSTMVYAPNHYGDQYHRHGDAFQIGIGYRSLSAGSYYGDFGSSAALDKTQLLLPEDSDFRAALLAAYCNPSSYTAHGKSAPDVSAALNLSIPASPANVMDEAKFVTTLYSGIQDYGLADGAKAYSVNLDGDKLVFHLIGETGSEIPHGTAAIIVSDTDSVTLNMLSFTETTAYAGNILQGSDTDIPKPAGTVYVLGVSGGTLGFYTFTGSTIPAGKAYYVVE